MSQMSLPPKTVYIDPLTDSGFKILFGRESSADILMGFLNALLEGDGNDPITSLRYGDKEKVHESQDGRSVLFDIH